MSIKQPGFRPVSFYSGKVVRKFIFLNEDGYERVFYINVLDFQYERGGFVALCDIVKYLQTKQLLVSHRKYYMHQYNAIIQIPTHCVVTLTSLPSRQIFLKPYDSSKSNQQIFAENQCVDEDRTKSRSPVKKISFFEPMQLEADYIVIFDDLPLSEDEQRLSQDKAKIINAGAVDSDTLMEEERFAMAASVNIQQFNRERIISSNKPGRYSFSMQVSALSPIHIEENQQNHQQPDRPKKPKQYERSIRNVIEIVKTWRELHNSKMCNLTEAAQAVGISKKSLDDYFLVLRVGQAHNFNYAKNLHKKMGDLRAFIRKQLKKVTGKQEKNVKCFGLVPPVDLKAVMQRFHRVEPMIDQANQNSDENDSDELGQSHSKEPTSKTIISRENLERLEQAQ